MTDYRRPFTVWLLEWQWVNFPGTDIATTVLAWREVSDFPDAVDGLDYLSEQEGHIEGVVLPKGVSPEQPPA